MDDRIKQRNLDSAILFMQQEHAQTLKGLHEEIATLQKRCSELNFQVAMANTSVSQEDEYREKCETLEKELSTVKQKSKALEVEVQQKDKRISFLEQTVNSRDRKIHDLKETHKQAIQELQTQLNAKSDTIAVLTSKLHQLHQQTSHHIKHTNSVQNSQESRGSSATSSTESSPRVRKSAEGKSRHYRHLSSQDHERISKHVPVPPLKPPARIRSGRKLPEKPQTPENIPDPTPFLSRDEKEVLLAKKERTVLPPISQSIAHTVVSTQKAEEYMYVKKSKQNIDTMGMTSPEIELETLAMSSVAQKDHCLHQPQDYKSAD